MKKVILTLTTALLIISGITVFKNLCSCDIPISNRGIKNAVDMDDTEILFLGSSAFRSDLDMGLIDDAYDGKGYDISYGGNQLVACTIQYDEIKKRSSHGYGLMVFELNPMMLTQQVSLSDSRVIWDLSWEGKKALYKSMYEAGSMTPSSTYEYFVTSGIDDLFTYPVTEPFYATRYYKGAKTEATASPGREVLETGNFDISDEVMVEAQADAVRRLIEKCERDGQAYIFIEPPRYHRLQEDPVFIRCRDEFGSILDEYDAPRILASDMAFDASDPALFEDMNHMSDEGRKKYTQELISLLKEYRF